MGKTMHQKIAEAATSASYTISASTIVLGLSINEIAAIGGLVLGLATFVVNWVYRHRHYQLAKTQSPAPGQPVD